MTRSYAYYADPRDEEEERRREIEEAFGPAPNLGIAPVPRIPLDMTTPRRTDGDYSGYRDPYEDDEPTEEELAADVQAEREDGGLDALVQDNPYVAQNLGDYASRLRVDDALTKLSLDRAPEPVDKRAASVSAEQKGVPANLLPPERTSEELAEPGARTGAVAEAITSEPPASSRDYTNASDRMMRTPQQGERSDMLGIDDEEGFSRQKAIDAVRAGYGEETPAEHRWEDEFLANHKRRTDEDIDRAWLMQSTFFGNERGDRVRQMLKGEQQQYEQGLAGARSADVGTQRVPLALAEAIAATGAISPESAAQLRMNSPLVKAYSSGLYSQGGRAEGQQIGLAKNKLDNAVKLALQEGKIDHETAMKILGSATQLDVAQIYANKGQPNTPEAKALNDEAAASLMAQALGVDDPAIGARALAGDYGELSPKQRALAMRLGPQLRARAAQNKGLDQVLNDSIRTQATQPIKDSFSFDKTMALARNNPQQRTKFKADWNDASIAFKEAWQGWKSLSPEGKAALAEWAAGGWTGKIRSFLMQPGDQERIAAVQGVINALVKDRSGSAVTGSEWERIASEIGLTADDWNPFNRPEAIEKFLKISGDKLTSHRRVFEQEYGWNPREVGDGR